jgi:hypothetical protein
MVNMFPAREKTPTNWLNAIGRSLLKRLESPIQFCEKRIINNMENLYRVIRKGDVVLVEGCSEMSRIIQILTQSSWSHAAFYVGDALEGPGIEGVKKSLDESGDRDRRHMMIEADTGSGAIAVPLIKYKDYNIRICRPFGISEQDLEIVAAEVISNLGKRYNHHNVVDLALLLLPSFLNPFKKRTIKACLGGCTEYEVICSGMIAKAFQKVGYPIVPALMPESGLRDKHINNPYGSELIMRHYSQIAPRDFDLSPNFEIVKYNIFGMAGFDYHLIWAEKGDPV